MRIVSIGDLVSDYYYKNGVLIGINGGMTSHNIIANISKLGLETSVYGVCGNDIQGIIAIKSLSDIGVNTENIEIKNVINTRCFHVSYEETNSKLSFKSKKRCPFCNEKKWYENSEIDTEKILKSIKKDDILVFDNLNSKNQIIIDGCENKKMIDLGQYFELDNYSDKEIITKIKNKFDLINLNERVEKYLIDRFNLNDLKDIFKLLNPMLIIVTRGKKGSDFVIKDGIINEKLNDPAEEIDPTGAGDAFFSIFISEYIKNNYIINNLFIEKTFNKATKLTKKVVKKFGARGHIQKLYKVKKLAEVCSCQNLEISTRKQIKRCNLNINNLKSRIINAINSSSYSKINKMNFENQKNSLFVGTGGSFAGASFAATVINNLYGTNTISILPRDVYYRNNKYIDSVYLFTYSGTTNDVINSVSSINNNLKYIITKGEIQKIVTKTNIKKDNIISYRTGTNKGKERGFLSFEGAVAPASLFLKLYFEKNKRSDISIFITECLEYWKDYFDNYFKNNKNNVEKLFKDNSKFNVFVGDYTKSAGIDFESKIIESGIYDCLIHEKKNFSHGRFINYEHISEMKNIYFKQKTTSNYEKELLKYLETGENLIIESKYDGVLCEYDLLIASQYLIYFISNYLNIDISKPSYSDNSMNIYFYKGEL